MKLPNFSSISTTDFAGWIKQAVDRREFAMAFEGIELVCKEEIEDFEQAFEQPIQDFVTQDSFLHALSQIYPAVTPIIRQAIENKIFTPTQEQLGVLDIISITYVAFASNKPCTTMNCDDPRLFIIRNKTNHTFWQWFRAHLPYNIKLARFTEFNYPLEFVLPSIIISNPHDLQFYKVFCREIKARMPEVYRHLQIESKICKQMIARLKLREKGIVPPPRSVPAAEAKNNLLVLDVLR